MAKENHRPYQKKSFISRMPAKTINIPTVMERYSVTQRGIVDKKYNNPKPASKYTIRTEKIYNPPRSSILLVDCFPASMTEIIRTNTPIAQGLMESIAAVVMTVINVGKVASTAMQFTPFQSCFIAAADFVRFFLFWAKFYNDTISW